jgi:Ala-tRNA(Pro) deacylase
MVDTSKPEWKLSDKATTEAWLTEHEIPFHTVTHEPAKTIAQMLEVVKFENEFAETKFAKNLFLYDKKKKERMWLVIAAHDSQFSMKKLEKHLGCGNGNLRGAQPEVLEATLGVKGGSVNLFAIMNDPNNKVSLMMDKRLLSDYEYVGFHPMQNDYTTAIKRDDVHKIIKLSAHAAIE